MVAAGLVFANNLPTVERTASPTVRETGAFVNAMKGWSVLQAAAGDVDRWGRDGGSGVAEEDKSDKIPTYFNVHFIMWLGEQR